MRFWCQSWNYKEWINIFCWFYRRIINKPNIKFLLSLWVIRRSLHIDKIHTDKINSDNKLENKDI